MADRIRRLREVVYGVSLPLSAVPSDDGEHIVSKHFGVEREEAWVSNQNNPDGYVPLFTEGVSALPLLLDVVEAAGWARDHINAMPHGDNCHLTDDGDGAGCRCGKESLLEHLDTALAALEGEA